jgi:putative phosphoribosyl transferase
MNRAANTSHRTAAERPIVIPAGDVGLSGDLAVPDNARAAILFAHGSGSSRHSRRNRYVANVLQSGGFATLLLDLLTEQEEAVDQVTRHLRFDIPLLAERLTAAVDWLQMEKSTRDLSIGLFGASTGAAAALMTAAVRPEVVGAVVSRGGRPDLAEDSLPLVRAPTLLIVGGRDEQVLDLNASARRQMHTETELSIVPGATHLFEEPGTLESVAELALAWFSKSINVTAASSLPQVIR